MTFQVGTDIQMINFLICGRNKSSESCAYKQTPIMYAEALRNDLHIPEPPFITLPTNQIYYDLICEPHH